MNQWQKVPPVAIFGFIRPSTTARVFDRVRAARPTKLFLCLDAPRPDHPGETEKCAAVQRIFANVDWPCEVYTNYAEKNMGCRARMGSGISWVFEHVPEAIILEDDCVPDASFFTFCAELLERYRDDMRVGMIAGHVAHLGSIQVHESYYFDRLNTIWGWATWRRAWCKFDAQMIHWPRCKETVCLRNIFASRFQVRNLTAMFDAVFEKKSSSWATAWALTCIRENFLCAHPTRNLITNMGCGADATHTRATETSWSCRPLQPMPFPLSHPLDMMPNLVEEEKTMRCLYARTYMDRVRARMMRYLRLG